MKNFAFALLLVGPFALNAQEPVKENKGTNTPPTTEKSISEKGISHPKGRGITAKKKTEETVQPSPSVVTPVKESKTEQTPQEDPKKKDKKDVKEGTSTNKSISEKGVSTHKKRSAAKVKPAEKQVEKSNTNPVDKKD